MWYQIKSKKYVMNSKKSLIWVTDFFFFLLYAHNPFGVFNMYGIWFIVGSVMFFLKSFFITFYPKPLMEGCVHRIEAYTFRVCISEQNICLCKDHVIVC